MNNKLVRINPIWHRIKKIITAFFSRKSTNNINTVSKKTIVQENNLSDSLKKEMNENSRKKYLAQKLLYGEIGPSDLTEEEIDEMTNYLKKDIQEMDVELMKIRQHILQIKQQIN